MPRPKYQIRTAQGVFDTVDLAAQAHEVSRSTILLRCDTHPDQYQKIPLIYPAARPRTPVVSGQSVPAWPLPWSEYRSLSWDQRDLIWCRWLERTGLDPELTDTVDAFFDPMDQTVADDSEQESV